MQNATFDFTGTTALITGATSGIGKDAAIAFAKAGANVVLTGRRAELGEHVAAEASAAGSRKAVFVQGDITDEEHIKQAVQTAVETFGGLHIAINNAGVETAGAVAELEAADISKVLDINVKGLLLSMKHEIPAILKTLGGANAGGSIINLGSVAGHIGMAGASVYIASKHAVLGATKCAALELATQGIRVNAVSPGGVETDMLDRFSGGNQDAMAGMHPMGRIAQPREITDAMMWLASAQSSFVTGQSIVVDGGLVTP